MSYALPTRPIKEGEPIDSASLDVVREMFVDAKRWPRFEFLREYTPGLEAVLEANSYALESLEPVLCCDAAGLVLPPRVPGLKIARLASDGRVSLAQELLTVQRVGFDDDDQREASARDARGFLSRLGRGAGYVVTLNGWTVAAGVYQEPHDGLSEVAGITTLPDYRRRGIAAFLTARIAQDALDNGATMVFLAAENESASRIYQRLGFRKCAISAAMIAVDMNLI